MKNATRKTLAQDDLYLIVTKNTLHVKHQTDFFTMFRDNIICESDYVIMTSYFQQLEMCKGRMFFA